MLKLSWDPAEAQSSDSEEEEMESKETDRPEKDAKSVEGKNETVDNKTKPVKPNQVLGTFMPTLLAFCVWCSQSEVWCPPIVTSVTCD